MIDYRMHTFLTVCKTMNYRAAAELLNITQPSVSQHIHYLEEHYGCKLFLYNGKQLSMTPEAEILKYHAEIMHYQEQRLLQDLIPQKGHTLSIGATKTIGEYVIAEQVAGFLKEPENKITVEIDNTSRILDLLNHGQLDFALIEGYFDRSRYDSILYRKEPFIGFCSAGHPFAYKEVPLESLWQENIIIREEGSGTRNILHQLLHEHNRTVDDFARVSCISNFGLLERLVAEGSGITFAYEAAGAGNPLLSSFHVKGWDIFREFNYVFLPNTDAVEKVLLFDRYR